MARSPANSPGTAGWTGDLGSVRAKPRRGGELDQSQAARDSHGSERKGRAFSGAWRTVSAVFGTLLGLVPHVLHHVGLLAGTALVSGAGGNLVFGVLGLVLSIPLLRRLYRRFDTWIAPAIALAVFAIMFSLSAFVIGPALSGSPFTNAPTPVHELPVDHSSHHE